MKTMCAKTFVVYPTDVPDMTGFYIAHTHEEAAREWAIDPSYKTPRQILASTGMRVSVREWESPQERKEEHIFEVVFSITAIQKEKSNV